MVVLSVAVALVGVLCLLDLLLTVGVIRRLRAAPGSAEPVEGVGLLEAGEPVGAFEAEDVRSDPVRIDGDTLVVFVSPTCQPCRRLRPQLVEHARALGDRNRVLAVVVAQPTAAAADVAALEDVARVVVEPPGGPIADAFEVSSYPALFRVVDGTVRASGRTVAAVSRAATASGRR